MPAIILPFGAFATLHFLGFSEPCTKNKTSKVEYGDYRKAVVEWEKLTGEKVDDNFKAKLQQKQQQVKEKNRHTGYHKKNDRGAR